MKMSISEFKKEIWSYYTHHGRLFDWRHTDDPYKVFISEVMLQQTQTHRVIQKYREWLKTFPNFYTLANASLKEVLIQWQGLGYNRRALFLQRAAQEIITTHQGRVPQDSKMVEELPGIGKATAASIITFAYNKPTVFIETNIRAVYIYFFFNGQEKVHDRDILPLVQETVDPENPRDWYYALMDYGVMLKKQYKNPSRKSVHHHKQSTFKGSDRELRGKILKILTQKSESILIEELIETLAENADRVIGIVEKLKAEKFVIQVQDMVSLVS